MGDQLLNQSAAGNELRGLGTPGLVPDDAKEDKQLDR